MLLILFYAESVVFHGGVSLPKSCKMIDELTEFTTNSILPLQKKQTRE